MKILILSPHNSVTSGYGNITHELCSRLSDIDFTLLLPSSEKKYDYTNYKTEYVLPDFIFNAKTIKVIDYLTFKYDASDYDIVHSLFAWPYAPLAARIAKQYNKPLIVGAQGTYGVKPLLTYPEKSLMKWAYNRAEEIIVPSCFTKESIIKYSDTKTPINVIHNAVNFERFQKHYDVEDLKKRFGGKKILLTVGEIKPRKGQDIVVMAVKELAKRRDDFHYVIIGSGGNRLKSILEREGLDKHVSLLGEVSGVELVKYFQLCYMYVHTPRLINWKFEGFGIVYLEASSCKKPIVASDFGGIRDAVLDGETGFVIPENDPVKIAGAIEKLLDSPELASRFGENGFAYAKKHDWPLIAERFVATYNKYTNE